MRQAQALQIMMSGANVFLTGSPGAGKTYVLNQFIRLARKQHKTVAVTASTGIAATHIGGVTIHSWSGLGVRETLETRDLQQLSGNTKLVKRYNATDVLVIDEVSMLHGRRLDMVDQVCRLLRASPEPFGGLQVILVGDLFQLPPVSRGTNEVDFVHLSAAWRQLNPQICYLTEQHRQTGDDLLALLEAMRSGTLEEYHQDMLTARLNAMPDTADDITRLYAHNVDIDAVNQRHLRALSGEGYEYSMDSAGQTAKIEQLKRSVLAPEVLELKTGAQVMFVANHSGGKFANGTRGVVVDFREGTPLVQLLDNQIVQVEPHSWKLEEDGRMRAEISQLPLRLAWAITIHKSQGMSLDTALVDLSRSFTPGMGYVALSRVRSLDGLYLTGINAMALRLHPDIYDFDQELRFASQTLAEQTPDFTPARTETVTEPIIDESLLAKLKTWRRTRAHRDSVPPYIIAHDNTLEAIAAKKPTTDRALLGIRGLGPQKIKTYGPDILSIVVGDDTEGYNL